MRLTQFFTRLFGLSFNQVRAVRKPGRRITIPSYKKLVYKLSNDPQFKFRFAAVCAAAFLGICALLLGLSLVNALFGLQVFPAWPGNLFAGSYGILAFFIPVYLGYAAFILADPRWRPDRIFVLSAGIFPFLTLAVGFTFIRDFEVRAGQFAFLDFAGKTVFGFVIVFCTMLEALALRLIKTALFPSAGGEDRRARQGKTRRGTFGPFLLPPPRPSLSRNHRPHPNRKLGFILYPPRNRDARSVTHGP